MRRIIAIIKNIPDGYWKCRECGEIWMGEQLYLDPSRDMWVCANLFCDSECDRVELTPQEEVDFLGKQLASNHARLRALTKT